MTSPEKIAEGFRFPECPRWRDDGLYFVDMYDDRVYCLDLQGRLKIVVEIPNPAGLGWARNGDILVVSAHARELFRLSPAGLDRVCVLDQFGYLHLNDMVVDRGGRAYIGGLGEGLYEGKLTPVPLTYVSEDGLARIVADNLNMPNGMAITPDGRTLIVAETNAHRLTAFDIEVDGSLSRQRAWADFGTGPSLTMEALLASNCVAPDGIALDCDGTVWVADAKGGGVIKVAEGGKELDRISFGAETVIAAALGGRDGREIYMTVGPPLPEISEILRGGERRYKICRSRLKSAP